MNHDRLKQVLDYDRETGVFTWKIYRNWRVPKGKEAGRVSVRHGYIHIRVDNKSYSAHRLAWFYVYGEWPDGHLDHIDGNRTNNSIRNLRIATRSQNQANRKNTPGRSIPRGVYSKNQNGPWKATFAGKHLGTFKDIQQAAQAYRDAQKRAHGEFAWKDSQ